MENDFLKVNFDSAGNLQSIQNKENSLNADTTQSYCYYKSKVGNNQDPKNQSSGAYIFRPQENTPVCYQVKNFTLYKGELFDEIHQVFTDWLTQTIRLYKNSTNAEFNWQVGPINVDDVVGKEVIFKLDSNINSNKVFYTDSNGREIVQRVRDFRHNVQDFPLSEKVAGNYYPINTRIFIRDSNQKRQLTLVTDRSQGASSLKNGSMEIMLHRRILFDDGFGVHDPLNELGADQKGLIIRGTINLMLNGSDLSARLHRPLSHEVNLKPIILFVTNSDDSYEKLDNWSAIELDSLPRNMHMLTLMKDFYLPESQGYLLVRLEHFYEKNEDQVYSESIQVDLQEVFDKIFTILGVEELALASNMNVADLNDRLIFNNDNIQDEKINKNDELKLRNIKKQRSSFIFDFSPMQIRTFRIRYNLK